jgi:alpha-L-rhamnosidase
VARATASICGLGYYELFINGRKIGDRRLDPGFTDFSKRVLYVTYDVTGAVRQGENALGVMLGGGWYDLPAPDLFGNQNAPWSASPRLLLRLRIELADGSTQTLVSDSSWKWSTGEILFQSVRGGETHDMRLAKPGWNTPGYNDRDWQPVTIVSAPAGKLRSQQHPAIKTDGQIACLALTEPKPGIYVFKLAENTAGWPRFAVSGTPGQKITLRANEGLKPDGTISDDLRTHTQGRYQTDEIILKGQGREVLEPRLCYHGFQYVQVEGLHAKPALADMVGIRVHTRPDAAGEFACSDERLNRLQTVLLRTYLNNLHGIPTDCPQREKMGWLGDGCVGEEFGIYNFSVPQFYTKWFHDMCDAQDPGGHVPSFVPCCGWGRVGGNGAPGQFADPWWGGAIVITPWRLYTYYGDRRVLEDGYPAMRAYVDYLGSTTRNGIIGWRLGDWLDESAGGAARRAPVDLTSTACYFYTANILSQVAAILDKQDDHAKYASLAESIRRSFNQKFLNATTGLYAADSQTAQAMPLAFGIAPDQQRPLVEKQLVQSILGPRRRGHVSTGIIGTLYLFHALMQTGRDDLAYTMLTQEDYPGWLYMLNQGSTAVWEAWDGNVGNGSRNHPALGSAGLWLYQGLAGIRPAAPGFKQIIIKPAVVGKLTWVKASYHSIYGVIRSAWKRDGNRLTLDVTIPANTTATVFVPAADAATVTEGGKPAAQAEGVGFLRMDGPSAVFAVASGSYSFQSLLSKSPATASRGSE